MERGAERRQPHEAPIGLSLKEADALSLRNRRGSPLLRLPAELRNRIYDHVFGGLRTQAQMLITPYKYTRTVVIVDDKWLPALWTTQGFMRITTICR
ncbi:hypothetical protein CC86DRAFT_401596 [Ophiobolus disseminans]|uniref:Uncharacterized protein n=1 Tax=Ophiobolus disseminans TaxID=1469910 RepID=A0A6A7AEF2_9PLEO|nr:hypothetical protein CC86DRAFT_401596 [Ophiobolus disseminans]